MESYARDAATRAATQAAKDTGKKGFQLFKSDMSSRNFRLGLLSGAASFATGIGYIPRLHLIILFGILATVQGIIVYFVEIPFLYRIFRVPDFFISFVKRFEVNWARALYYAVNAVIQWLSLFAYASALLFVAILYSLTAVCYGIAWASRQSFHDGESNDEIVDVEPGDPEFRTAL
ncbi:unnamed protein product [Kuraishia capsulata CBS 1993]|uniref:Golgi apparatus membrane protein TVP18 n=1 Tax=Kuraishia capsulata CBS 1993 TaxID=1382522 RepID=W6MQ87_9ASCO|nr:uncharacterized protein KUCA_T00003405001 [Kuraishia capsulata CBS 1993]CDK27427.1 unnamed protein product [Kuraishia capsulata CBS 1993]